MQKFTPINRRQKRTWQTGPYGIFFIFSTEYSLHFLPLRCKFRHMSMHEVALKAGVSQATVSKVVNNYPSVSATNIKRVRQAMQDLGYHPTPRKASAKTHSTSAVAVLIFPGAIFQDYRSSLAKMILSIESELRSNEIDMLLAHVTDVKSLPELVRSRRVSGLILGGSRPSQDVLQQLEGIPSIWVSSHLETQGSVMLEGNEAVGKMAAEYLIDRGHQRLGVINALAGHPVLDKRCDYFRYIAESAKCTHHAFLADAYMDNACLEDLCISDLENSIDQCIESFLSSKNKPTGIFVPFDFQLAAVYRSLQKRNISIKGKFDFIGSDEESAALLGLYPRPATINVGPDVIGSRAVKELCLLIQHGNEDSRVRITVVPSLVPGD